MTDTEAALLRAVVDSPGQDTPRLVYADWLDDHDHPARAAFLRAEAEWAVPWRAGQRPYESSRLIFMAQPFDPVWVARVSRPPLGVCGDHIGFLSNRPRVTWDDILPAEAEAGVKFPPEYRAFLLNYNGGGARLNSCSPSPFPGDYPPELQPWFSLLPDEKPRTGKNLLFQYAHNRRASRRSYHTLLPLCAAEAGYYSYYAIGVGKRNFGRIYFALDYSLNEFPPPHQQVADALGYFLASILTKVERRTFDPDDEPGHEPTRMTG